MTLQQFNNGEANSIVRNKINTNFLEIENVVNAIQVPAIVDALNSVDVGAGLSANQGRLLKEFIDNINGLLFTSDDTLDEIQEIVDFIKANRNDLDALSVSNIAGLQTVLNTKVDKDGTKVLSDVNFTTAKDTKLSGIAAGAQVNTITSVAGKTGAVTLVKADVGLSSVDNTSDAAKPVSTAQQTALNLKANLASPTFTGTVAGITKSMVGLANVDNTADTAKPVSTAQQTALNLKANLASPTFTGTVSGITKAMVGLGSVDNTTDAAKPISTATQTALNAKVTVVAGKQLSDENYTLAEKNKLSSLTQTGQVEIIDALTSIDADKGLSANQGRILKGFIDSVNTLLVSDDTNLDQLQEIVTYIKQNKSDLQNLSVSNIAGLQSALDAKEATFTKNTGFNKNFGTAAGTVSEGNHTHTKAQVGLSNVDNTADTAKPVSTAQQTALNLKANLASPTFTGTVSGITKAMVGLSAVDNTSDANKPVSTAQATAIATKLDKVGNVQAFWSGTQAQYDAIGTKSTTTIYFIE